MVKSMTGYGRAVETVNGREFTVEVRSVNNRYLDCTVKLPRGLSFGEDAVKQAVKATISRGKVDVFVSVRSEGAQDTAVSLNKPMVEGYLAALKQLQADYGVTGEITVSMLSGLPDVFLLDKPQVDEQQLLADFLSVAEKALASFNAMRTTEGVALAEDLRSRGETILSLVSQVEAGSPQTVADYRARLEAKLQEARLASETIDVTLPGKTMERGHLHPNQVALREIEDIFIGMGYEVVDGPEVEKDYYNFEALNIPANHPAKDEQDTFYLGSDMLLRTQTSGVQIHEMERGKIPIRMIAPGRVYRADEVDATHSPVFHQVEGLVVDKGITFADLKGTLAEFAKGIFGEDTKVRFRPHHFPFTEPSAEMDISCFKCHGKGCSFCKNEGWIEILGCGMVHPHVLEMSHIDPEVYSGFAFGIGLERIALLKYEIDDMRLLYENDIRFLKQF